jgi:hypothetical protein
MIRGEYNHSGGSDLLLWTNSFVDNVFVFVRSSTGGAKSIHGRLDIVVAELTYLSFW